jgi:predicted CXXCH cytochrome family protein
MSGSARGVHDGPRTSVRPVLSRLLLIAAVSATFVAFGVPSAFAATPPHVVASDTVAPDACAICHRAHTGNVDLPYRTTASTEPTGNSLIMSPTPARGDVGLCYICHGAAGLGSSLVVETSFTLVSSHTIAAQSSAYGPSPKMCGSCHDPHGSDRVAGLPYSRLLRAWESTTVARFSGEEYCAACHVLRAGQRWDGVGVYRSTGHYTGLTDPPSGTGIRCVNCHAAHGSNIRPLINGVVVPPAGGSATVAANDRRQCLACHVDPSSTWSGETTYATSGHGSSVTSVAVIGEWPLPGAQRRVGECQVCHAPMGRNAGSGVAIAKLLEKPGRQLCDTCHKPGGPTGAADLASLAYPASETSKTELVAVWGAGSLAPTDAVAAVYGRDTTDAVVPRPLVGPREFRTPNAGGVAAAGDVDLDGAAELVVADRAAKGLRIFQRDALRGLVDDGVSPIGISPDLIAVGRFVNRGAPFSSDSRDQIAVVDVATRELYVYGNWTGSALTTVAGPYIVGTTPNGIASGDVTGTGLPDLVVTDAADHFFVLAQNVAGSSDLVVASIDTTAGTAPRGPSIGDVNTATGIEIVLCLTGAGWEGLAVYDASGAALDAVALDGGAGAVPWASAIANVLPGVTPSSRNGLEVAVAMRAPAAGASQLAVVAEAASPAAGLDPASVLYYDTPSLYRSGSVAVADVDGDGKAETVLGNAGIQVSATGMLGPSLRVYRPDVPATGLDVATTLVGGGAELAGTAPAIITADFGGVTPSRHPVDAVAGAHVSTETASFARHVTCSDCHDSHESTATVSAGAPAISGRMRGAWGTEVTNLAAGTQFFSASARATNQYEVCFKCHATTAGGRTDIAAAVNTLNPSMHMVEPTATVSVARAGSFTSGWGNSSVLLCTDCHGDSAGSAEATGTHRSAAAPILRAPYAGVAPDAAALLCYACHLYTTYADGSTDGDVSTGSRFYDATHWGMGPKFHSTHVSTNDLGCSACHVSHGSATLPHLLREDIGYLHDTGAGSYSGTCGGSGKCHEVRAYDGP